MQIDMPNFFAKNIDKYFWKFIRIILKSRDKITKSQRRGSYPYVTGDSFRKIADHIYDEIETFDPDDVKTGDIVFVGNPKTQYFLKSIHPLIKNRYILIEHNGDSSIDKSVADLLDDKIIKFYAQDVIYEHEKIIPIPIGIENIYFYVNGIPQMYNYFIKSIEKNPPIKKNRVFFYFSVNTNPKERMPAKKYFSSHPCMDTVPQMLSQTFHLKTLKEYKFVASPPGNAIESCRTWDALYMKTIPIVKDFVSMKYFEKIGLPIWVVNDWTELDNYNEEMLEKKYLELTSKANWEPLHMEFWIKMVSEDQKKARKNIV